MTEDEQIKQYIDACDHMMKFFKKLLQRDKVSGLAPQNSALAELTDLRMLAKSNEWGCAYSAGEDEEKRAYEFLGSVTSKLSGAHVLDFGSCDLATARIVADKMKAKTVVSFDVNLCRGGAPKERLITNTDNLNIVTQMSPYDVILVNDVLDHMEKPVNWLKILGRMLNKQAGRMFVRCHPYTSRNGAHAGEQLNRAYLHLVFTEEELATFGISCRHTQKILDAQKSYAAYFEDAGLKVVSEKIVRCDPDMRILSDKRVSDRIRKNIGVEDGLLQLLEIDYIDYQLSL